MNKTEFLRSLKSELEKNRVNDIEDILADFEDHFANRLEEGVSEEEISRKIGSPEEIARDFANPPEGRKGTARFFAGFGLAFLDLFAFPFFLTIALSVLVLGIFAAAAAVLGVVLIGGWNFRGWIPPMPALPAVILGISCLSLSAVSALGTWSLSQYVRQWIRAFFRWHGNVLSRSPRPSLGKHPRISKRTASRLKFWNTVAVILFVASFTIGYLVSSFLANSLEFWHVWGWFVR